MRQLWEDGSSFSFTETDVVTRLIKDVRSFPVAAAEFIPPEPQFPDKARLSVVVPEGDGPRPGTAIPSM